ncbi:high frequency lysogenization protein HflD [Streptomyces sp. NBC_00876]|uniref:nickel/cobalt transporter n=1 Tax=Streptomyces sp. NBC_00876 TaxID=2975853 RepID=UPI003869B947|nr:high frequency lysogenization protein HflD [Streptomyces sp. NBC_00876]
MTAHRVLAQRAALVTTAALWLLAMAAPAAEAHPLGNFSINEYAGFTLHPDHVDVLAVTDTAEIPTLQATPAIDSDGDRQASSSERTAWAATQCAATSAKLRVTAPRRLVWTTRSATFLFQPGQGGLRTGRLECRLRAPLDLTAGPVTLRVDTGADRKRVGWHEITATGIGTRLQNSTVPRTSPTHELRSYPRDLLSTPRGDTTAQFTARQGSQTAGTLLRNTPNAGQGGGLTGRVEALSQRLTSMTGARDLTLPIGLLAVLLSLVLGAGHALLPGHGKTVMAAYLAGRRGSIRDAVTVGATVTITHTAGVIIIGLCLTTFSSLAGDAVLNWLGVISGALVTLVGATLLNDATRRSRRNAAATVARPAEVPPLAMAGAGAHGHASATTEMPHAHGHTVHSHEPHTRSHGHGHHHERRQRHGLFGHGHHHAHPHSPAEDGTQPFTTRGLIGLGVAGGLVPSPSALVVLLGAIALGRTTFGAALVLAYGIGMAATLTAVGILLVKLGSRAESLGSRPAFALLRRIAPYTALLTAALVLVVGLSLVARSLPLAL